MKLLESGIAETTWEDDNGCEWDIKIEFCFNASENAEYQEGHMVYPGCREHVEIEATERREYTLESMGTATAWQDWDEATDSEIDGWAVEILEAIKKRAHDDRGNEA